MACTNTFDVLKLRSEDLGPTLYVRASWKNPMLSIVPREMYPIGAGLVRSAFTIGRSEPLTEDESWSEITLSSGGEFTGSCGPSYTQTYVGFKQVNYKPEEFNLIGPPICQDELPIDWNSTAFWMKYFEALEKRNVKSITNRLLNIYMNYVPKASAGNNFSYIDGNIDTQPPGATVDMTGLAVPQCGLVQAYLDNTANILNQEGANDPNSNGWITMGDAGPVYPMLIGEEASNQLLLNNAELRADYRFAYQGFGDANPVIARIGASRIIKNFRHIINLFPPRWKLVGGALTRVPAFIMSTASADATKGRVAITNPEWANPNIAAWEAAIVLNPWVFTEEILQPINSAPGMTWTPQNYFGEWRFVTGNDAFLGIDGCTGISDPLHTRGRHFARYRHAAKPIFPQYGRMILFRRCPINTASCVSCS